MAGKQLLDAEETAHLLHMPIDTLYAYTSSKQIPHYKIGRRLLFDLDKILKWIEDHEVPMIK